MAPPGRPLRLATLAASRSEPVAVAGNRPIRLDEPEIAWFVEHGTLDVFVAEEKEGRVDSTLKHIVRVGAGRLVFGRGRIAQAPSLVTIAKGLPGCRLRRLELEDLFEDASGEELAAQVDLWISQCTASLVADITFSPRPELAIGPGEQLEAEAGCTLSGRRGGVTWVASGGAAEFLGTEAPRADGTGLIPLTSETWLTVQRQARMTGISSRTLHAEGRLAAALQGFHHMQMSARQLNRRLIRVDLLNREISRVAHRRQVRDRARQQLFGVTTSSRTAAGEGSSPLSTALEWIGRHEGIAFEPVPRRPDARAFEPSVRDVLRASGVRGRQVRIDPEDRWWRGDSGALLGFKGEDGRPVALLPSVAGGYRILDPVSAREVPVDAEQARGLRPEAWFFYRPLPHGEPVMLRGLLRLARKNLAADLLRFLSAGTLAGLVIMIPAVLLGMLADRVLLARSGDTLAQLAMALVAIAVAAGLSSYLRGASLVRLEGRIAARLMAAAWDRLLGMRVEFFRGYSAGDLAARVSVFLTLRDAVSEIAGGAILSVAFLVPAFLFIFLYDAALGWLTLGVGVLSLGVASAFGVMQIDPQRRHYAAARRISGDLFQFISGIDKLRSSGTEESAYAVWARRYREQQWARMQIGKWNEHVVAFSAAVPALVAAMLFAFGLYRNPDRLSAGDFLAVYAISMTFFVALARFGQSFEAIAAIVPGVEQVRPVLAAVPEAVPAGDSAVELSGEIRFDHLSFRYSEEGPPVLEDVSLRARQGEFIAIVGESGSGKSTLLRLALGLQEPSSGAVYYDGRDLAALNRRVVRRQIGVVMQDGALRPGNILENINGVSEELTLDDAWWAARQAVVDEDIAAMPMGMFTVVGDSAGTFSGGQTQRILLAAALARRPRILFLDEATSWLDARSQSRVMASIESLFLTRIVVAHRLSTIRAADRIYVLDRGRIVQEGGFDELMASEGLFRHLMRRQMF